MGILNLPEISPLTRKTALGEEIFDPVRKKYILLTPEEWVRQHWISYLQTHLHVSASWITVEYGFKLNGLSKRCDILVFDKQGNPLLVVECKAPHIRLDNDVFEQISRYNLVLQAPFLIVSNGIKHYALKINFSTRSTTFLATIPDYQDML